MRQNQSERTGRLVIRPAANGGRPVRLPVRPTLRLDVAPLPPGGASSPSARTARPQSRNQSMNRTIASLVHVGPKNHTGPDTGCDAKFSFSFS